MYTDILACNNTLGTCCSDPGMANIINSMRIFIEMIQIIAPILLIASAMIQLGKMIYNPDEKTGMKTLLNKFAAAIIIFVLPLFANLALSLATTGVGGKSLEVMACFEKSKSKASLNSGTYKENSHNKNKIKIISEKTYDKGGSGFTSTTNYSSTANGEKTAAAFLASLNNMSTFVKNDRKYRWYYKWPGNSKTFEKANKANNTHLTCILLPNWGYRDLGITKENQLFYQNPSNDYKLSFTNGAKAAIEKYATIYHFSPTKSISGVKSSIGLKPGDIIIWHKNHANVYAGTNSKGKMTFFDSGRGGDGGYKGGTFYFNSFGPVAKSYGNNQISDIIRLNS